MQQMTADEVDRTCENLSVDPFVIVTLSCGYSLRFWIVGLTDEEYIERTRHLKKREGDRP